MRNKGIQCLETVKCFINAHLYYISDVIFRKQVRCKSQVGPVNAGFLLRAMFIHVVDSHRMTNMRISFMLHISIL